MENKTKHLEFIQTTINRMANNSFLLKGWVITIVGGLFAFSMNEMNYFYILISLIAVIFFWLLDGYYLYQEKLFRKLYEHVAEQPEGKIDFSMKTEPFEKNVSWRKCFFSSTMSLFYGALFTVNIIIILFI